MLLLVTVYKVYVNRLGVLQFCTCIKQYIEMAPRPGQVPGTKDTKVSKTDDTNEHDSNDEAASKEKVLEFHTVGSG